MGEYAFFWGCTIPARFPFMEKSTRIVLKTLDVLYRDLDGFTCCPEKTLIKNANPDLWCLVAARNIAIAEKEGFDLLQSCTGCYSSLKSAWSQLKVYPRKRERLNEKLRVLGLEFHGNTKVRHLIEFLHDDLGISAIKSKVKKPLKKMRIAVHGGCHLVRPSNAIHFDDPLKPKKFDALIESLGAKCIDYPTKMMCCGGSLSRVDQHEKTFSLAKEKLNELTRLNVDALTVICPECFKVFDNFQQLMQKKGEKFHIPVITLTELMGLTFGFNKDELGIDYHRIDCSPFIEKFLNGKRERNG